MSKFVLSILMLSSVVFADTVDYSFGKIFKTLCMDTNAEYVIIDKLFKNSDYDMVPNSILTELKKGKIEKISGYTLNIDKTSELYVIYTFPNTCTLSLKTTEPIKVPSIIDNFYNNFKLTKIKENVSGVRTTEMFVPGENKTYQDVRTDGVIFLDVIPREELFVFSATFVSPQTMRKNLQVVSSCSYKKTTFEVKKRKNQIEISLVSNHKTKPNVYFVTDENPNLYCKKLDRKQGCFIINKNILEFKKTGGLYNLECVEDLEN